MKRKIIVITSFFICLIFTFCFLKMKTDIYIGDYSSDCCSIDIRLKVDNKLVLDDSLFSSSYKTTVVKERLRCGFHTVDISSKKAALNQSKTIFLLPNQHVYIEFFSADTLCLEEKLRAYETFPFRRDTLIDDDLFHIPDTAAIIENYESSFWIESRFNPFYLE